MRIDQDLLKIGDFWLPSDPNECLRGILSITEGGQIYLDVVGFFSSVKKGLEDVEIPRINGIIEDYGYVTLEYCQYKHLSLFSTHPKRSTIEVQMAVLGAVFGKDEALEFNSIGFTVEGANEWRFNSGIEVSHDFDSKTSTIHYEPQDDIEISLDKNFVLTIFSRWKIPGSPTIGEAKISEDTYFEVKSHELQNIDAFIDKARKIAQFLCFASDSTVSLQDVWVKRNDCYRIYNETTRLVPLTLVYPSRPYTNNREKISWHKFLFRYPDMSNKASTIFQNWFSAFTLIGPTVNLYFAATEKDTSLLEARFLFLVQAIETYHRRKYNTKRINQDDFLNLKKHIIEKCPEPHRDWLDQHLKYANEVNLRTRIKEVMNPFKRKFGSSESRKKLINDIVNTRNYLTHFDKNVESDAASGYEQFRLCIRMEVLLQLIILGEVGFESEEISTIIENNIQIQQKMKL